MNVLTRPVLAAFCSLCVVLVGSPAFGQKFMPNDIVEAETIDAAMNERIMVVVDGPMFDLVSERSDPEDITEARKQLQQFFRANQPTVAYLEALSAAIEDRIQPAVENDSATVRINSMIVLSLMVDAKSEKWIDTGLADKNDAVKRWAMEALGKRMLWWKDRAAAGAAGNRVKIDDAIKKIVKIVDNAQPPHPVVVGPALEALVRVDTPMSRSALIELLNKRVALHAADPDLSYAAERSAIGSFTSVVQFEQPPDLPSLTGLARATARYAAVIVEQFQADRILEEHEQDAKAMLFQCLQTLAIVSSAAKAPKAPPADHPQSKNWIVNDRWDDLKGMIEQGWATILVANPFKLKPADLKP